MSDFRREFLPYCLRPLGKDKWVILNRNYAALDTNEKTGLERFAVNLRLIASRRKKLSIKMDIEEGRDIFLYDDISNPLNSEGDMNHYLEKIKLLAKLEIK